MGEGANRMPIGVTMGDPGGIGPEVVAKAIAALGSEPQAPLVVFGDAQVLEQQWGDPDGAWVVVLDEGAAAEALGSGARVVVIDVASSGGRAPVEHQPTAESGAASFEYVERAIAACASGPLRLGALCTAPISKTAWHLAGHTEFPGHTEFLAERFGVGDRFAMLFVGPRLRVALVTVHEPLARVRGLITSERVRTTIELIDEACRRLGTPRPRIAVCGFNPHAGEQGLLGDEDESLIRPGIDAARAAGIDASGPFPADTVFLAASNGHYDGVVAMYHDQGLIPVKLLDRDEAVNVTVGLPVPRTSPAHGTAYDIAGSGRADPGSMLASLRLAMRLSGASPGGT